MAVTEQSYTGNGSTTNYPFTFPYLKSTDILVQLDQTSTTNWSLANATTIQFTAPDGGATTTQEAGGAPKSGVSIKILRDTNVDNLTATFYAGSAIKSEDLNDNYTQNLYKTQEIGNRSFQNTGTSTMIGHLQMGEDTTIKFEGATDNANETTLTVVDPTADRTITLPNVTGTVVTTGDTGTVATAMIADDAINRDKLEDDSVGTSEILANAVTASELATNAVETAKIKDEAVTLAKIEDITSTQLIVGNASNRPAAVAMSGDVTIASSGATLISANAVDSSKIADGTIVNADVSANAGIAYTKLDVCPEHRILVGNASETPTPVTMSGDATITSTGAITIANDAVEQPMIANDAVGADELAANAVVNDSVASGAAIEFTKLENLDSAKILVGNGSNKATEVSVSGDVTIANTGAVTIANTAVEEAMLASGAVTETKVGNDQITADKLADHASTDSSRAVTTNHIRDNAVTIDKIGCEETTLTANSNTTLPTSKAVADHVANVVDSVGGFKIVANKDSFPEAHPDPKGDAGMVISVTDPVGFVVNGSGVSTTGDTITSDGTVTINGFPSGVHSSTTTSNYTLLLQTTSTAHTYDFYRFLAKDADVLNLSDDINDFGNRYRTAANRTADNSNTNDDGDLFYDQTANKMYVYEGAYNSGGAWKEVTSTGQFKILTLEDTDGSAFDGANSTFNMKDGSNAASVTQASQLIVSVNGVVQKPNSGSSAPSEGFALVDADTIIFGAAPGAGASVFVTQCGSAVSLNVPADESVTEAMLKANAPTNNHVLTADSSAASGFKWAAGGDADKISEGNTTAEIDDGAGGAGAFKVKCDGETSEAFKVTDAETVIGRSGQTSTLWLGSGASGQIKFGASSGQMPWLRLDGSSNLEVTGAYNSGNSTGTVWTFGDYQGTHVSGGNINPSADSTYSLGTNSVRWTNGYFDNLYGDGSNLTGVAASSANGTMYKNTLSITDAHTIAATEGAHSVGPVSVGNTVTISGRWVIS